MMTISRIVHSDSIFTRHGNKSTETMSFEKLVEEGDWSGSKNNLVDKFGYGNYFLKCLMLHLKH